MAKVGVIYIPQTKHVLACVTVSGELDPKTTVADLVDTGVPLRDPSGNGQVVMFPSANDALKLVVADVTGDALKEVLTAPARMSIPDEKVPGETPGVAKLSAVTLPAASIKFTFTAPGKTLQVVLAHQRGAVASDNPASLIPDVVNPTDTSKTINVDYRVGDHIALFFEGFLPIVQ